MRNLFLLDPEVVFLNHGSFGACPRPVFERYQAWQLQLERQPVAFLDPERGYWAWMRATREALGAALGAQPGDLVGVINATQGLNIVAQSLPLAEGDEILTCDHEYSALDKTWAYVCRRTGARIVRVEVPMPHVDAVAFTRAILAGITPRTRVIFLSHITSPTALLFPLEEIVAEARRLGIWTVIDGAHTPAHVPLNLDALGADFYSGNCHKWMMAPKGAAFLHVRRELQPLINPLVISHGWTEDRQEPGPFGETAFVDSLEMQGTRDPSAWLTVPEAIAFQALHGWPQIARECHQLAWETVMRLAVITGEEPLSSEELCAPQMVAIPVPSCDPRWLKQRLLDDYAIEVPVFDWKDRTIVRLSVQCYNTRDEMDLLVKALGSLLKLPKAA